MDSILGVGAMQTVCAQNDFLSLRDTAPCSRSSMLIFEFAVGGEIRNLRKNCSFKIIRWVVDHLPADPFPAPAYCSVATTFAVVCGLCALCFGGCCRAPCAAVRLGTLEHRACLRLTTWLICIEPDDQHRRKPEPRESNRLHPRRNFLESRVSEIPTKAGTDIIYTHARPR